MTRRMVGVWRIMAPEVKVLWSITIMLSVISIYLLRTGKPQWIAAIIVGIEFAIYRITGKIQDRYLRDIADTCGQ